MIQDIYPHRFENGFVAGLTLNANDYVFCFKGNALLMKRNHEGLAIPQRKHLDIEVGKSVYLFAIDGKHCFLIWDSPDVCEAEFVYHEIHFRHPFDSVELDWLSSVALQLKNWYGDHRYCGKCGAATIPSVEERAIACPSCKRIEYPIIAPAIIVAIISHDTLLLARGAQFPEGFYSLVAGYVDIGESIEETVVREVREEVGIAVKNIRYYKSQPWPFSGSMMMGFVAEAVEGQKIQVDNHEILEAGWYHRHDLPSHPSERSIAGEMIEKFRRGELG
ncbi:NAD(+) diphosphatase [Saccharicrinis fermentans]|uniref:NAD(+) diphosphatase n=1 Tax=Saccharicrinis fermentans DSM 9555 = JCM 21142 TaxID=869213 RepID=W7YHR7_9BACT|nr:NAD(+) diphosphatase [Saccharicrinis fermentans]GAF04021.1 NADH pyrophosphatase [Saccharicrinis fermentans DSM 9555 = JCM 21142]